MIRIKSFLTIGVIWIVIIGIHIVHARRREWWFKGSVKEYDPKHFIEPSESSSERDNIQVSPPPWEPMIKPEFNQLIRSLRPESDSLFLSKLQPFIKDPSSLPLPSSTLSASVSGFAEVTSSSAPPSTTSPKVSASSLESVEFRGESSQENLHKRWPSKDELEKNLFKQTWRDGGDNERGSLVGGTNREPDWNSEDPFGRFDRRQPDLGPPIYHRDVEEIRRERTLPNGYDKSVSRLSRVTWDDKEEYPNSQGKANKTQNDANNSDSKDQPAENFDEEAPNLTDISRINPSEGGDSSAGPSSSLSPISGDSDKNNQNSENNNNNIHKQKLKKSTLKLFKKMVTLSQSNQVTKAPINLDSVDEKEATDRRPPRFVSDSSTPNLTNRPNKLIQPSGPNAPFGTRLNNLDRNLRSPFLTPEPRSATTTTTTTPSAPIPTTSSVRAPFWHTFNSLSTRSDQDENENEDNNNNGNGNENETNDNGNNNGWENTGNDVRRRRGPSSVDIDLTTTTEAAIPYNDDDDTGGASPVDNHLRSTFNSSLRSRSRRRHPPSESPSTMFRYETNIEHISSVTPNEGSRRSQARASVGVTRVRKQARPRKRTSKSPGRIQTTPSPFIESTVTTELVTDDLPFDTTTIPPTSTTTEFVAPPPEVEVSTNGDSGSKKSDLVVEVEDASQGEAGSGRLEDSIRGSPGQDYGTYTTVPQTSFRCSDQQYPGYYGDTEAQCQVFHICQTGGRQDDFLCPIGTVFNQQLFVCDWWYNFRCEETPNYYVRNAEVYADAPAVGSNTAISSPRVERGNSGSIGSETINDGDESGNSNGDSGGNVDDGEDLPDKSKVYFDDDEKATDDGDENSDPAPAISTNTRRRRTGSAVSNRRSKKLDSQNIKKSEKNVEKKQEGKEDTEYYFDDDNQDSNSKRSKQADDDSTDL
ncbi:uncharacterized protein LOC141854263 [Brevipalpus obovatus]|uniref:uncharacterized protein LOC141854263 n=1 Tax=Brevipalpus obovatus TaxID=246614 RepID=UPI003D9F0B34